jgi:acyl-CoA synthetase (NDP forming)/GNAT superfamily N-acetyltransferase
VLTADGAVVHVRPVHPDDGPGIRAMHRRMGPRSLYLRYFTAVDEITNAQLEIYLDVDHVRRVCLVAVSGSEIVGAGSYHADPTHPQRAEVAFAVQDDQQGRGLGSILLEHLAAAAQERGVTQFTAEVLSENRPMMRVFLDAGYAVTREYSSGVVDLAFDISPTVASRAVLASREQHAEARSITRLLSPKSVAVIGASTDPTKIGHAVLVNLLRGDFAGPVYPVNAESVSVQGVRAYPTVTDIPDAVDLAVVAVPAAAVADVMQECRAKQVQGLVVVSAGFADATEAQPAGAAAQRHLVTLARSAGMRVLGPNCLGLMNTDPTVRMNATLAPVVPPPGRIGFFCQSGALGIAILADAASRKLGLSSFVSAGNRADVSGNDLLQFWQTDDRTEVVLLYLESFGNPRKFARLARSLARKKPVIAVKSGRHAMVPEGLRVNVAPISDAAVATLFEQSGVIRTQTLTEAFDVAQLLASQPLPPTNCVAIIGNSTALGLLAVDACLDAGLTVADSRPLDLGVAATPDELADAVRSAVTRADVGAVIVVYVPPVATAGLEHAGALRSAAVGSRIPVLTTFLAVEGLPEQLAVIADDGVTGRGSVPSYPSPERAVAALAHAARYAAWQAAPTGDIPALSGIDRDGARELVEALRATGSEERALTDEELRRLLACYGVHLTEFRLVEDEASAVAAAGEIGYPVVLKSFDQSLRHREDRVGVRLDLADGSAVVSGYRDLAASTGAKVYVQRLAPPENRSVSTIFSITADQSFGALISFGIGGVATELLDDLAYRSVPLTDLDAVALIDAPRAAPLLDGYRGGTVIDRAPLVDLALRLSALADDLPEVGALHLRPVLAGPGGIAVTGATGRIGPPPARPDERRRLR